MLQRGIETPDMDVRWVSSLSWYFLNFFGLNGLYRLILGNDNCMFRSTASFTFEICDRSCASFTPLRISTRICTHFRSKSTYEHSIFPIGTF
jgi:hypothetical protein